MVLKLALLLTGIILCLKIIHIYCDDNWRMDYQVYIGIELPNESIRCGGTVYNKWLILTAAHCFDNAINATVYAGSKYWKKCTVARNVKFVQKHEKYNDDDGYDYDIAVVLLTEPLPDSKNIKPIKLARYVPAIGSDAIITGWSFQGKVATRRRLRKIDVKVIEPKECAKLLEVGSKFLTKNLICTTLPNVAVCNADPGGSMEQADTLVGIVVKQSLCKKKLVNVLVNIVALRHWIEKTILCLLDDFP